MRSIAIGSYTIRQDGFVDKKGEGFVGIDEEFARAVFKHLVGPDGLVVESGLVMHGGTVLPLERILRLGPPRSDRMDGTKRLREVATEALTWYDGHNGSCCTVSESFHWPEEVVDAIEREWIADRAMRR